MNLSDLRAITFSNVVTYNYFHTYGYNELISVVYPYPYYFQLRNLFDNKVKVYKLIEVENYFKKIY